MPSSRYPTNKQKLRTRGDDGCDEEELGRIHCYRQLIRVHIEHIDIRAIRPERRDSDIA